MIKAQSPIEQRAKFHRTSQIDRVDEQGHTASADKKLDLLERLLRRSSGAALGELMRATGWKAHSVRAAISKKKAQTWKESLIAERRGTILYYRLVDGHVSHDAVGSIL
jgi:hypothetical protein